MPYASKRKYTPKRKFTPKKGTKPIRQGNGNGHRKPYVKPGGSTGLKGFDRTVYKVDKIIDTVGRGFGVLGKPVTGIVNLAREINPFKLFRK